MTFIVITLFMRGHEKFIKQVMYEDKTSKENNEASL